MSRLIQSLNKNQEGQETHPILISIAVMLATVMQALDTTIANVALPHMQGSLSATQDQISWVLTSYIVAAAIATPATGFISARIGRKQLLIWSIIGFTLTSMLCGIALSLSQIVLFRLLQGLFGAALVPLSQAVLLDAYPKEKHGTALALWGIGVMVGPILGPTLGGYLTENYNWRWVFYINLPFGILALLGVLAYVKETVIDRHRNFDVWGFFLLTVAIGATQMFLDRGEQKDWFSSREIWLEFTLALLGLYLFIVHMATYQKPFLTPAMFKDRNFVSGCLFMFVVGIILLATIALLPPYLQNLFNYPVITVGNLLAPRGIGTMACMFIVGRLVGRIDPRLLIFTGLGLIGFSLYEMSGFSPMIGSYEILSTGIVQGIGLGFVFVPLGAVTFATLPPVLRTEAAGFFSLIRNLGSSIGISVVVALLAQNTQINHAELVEHLTFDNSTMANLPELWSLENVSGLAALNVEATRQALFIAYNNDFILMMWITFCSMPLVLLLKAAPGKTKEGKPKETVAALPD